MAEPNDLNLIAKTHVVEREILSSEVSSGLHVFALTRVDNK